MKPQFELADILELYGNDFFNNNKIPLYKQKVLLDIKNCRTAYFGGHVEKCSECGHTEISYNSCRNRHCPKCQGLNKEQWIRKCEKDLLPITYFHVIFTIPHELNNIVLNNQRAVYEILFKTAWSVINTFASDKKHLGAKTGMISILHTWGQNLSYHPHLHCIVPGGGITTEGKWKTAKSKGKFLFPVKAMSNVFRARFVSNLRKWAKIENIFLDKKLTDKLFEKQWVVYAKRPFGTVDSVIEYLGRYTHRIAISNHRIKSIDNDRISFSAKNYKNQGKKETINLSAQEFLRRFCLHILPRRFVKIRRYGFLCNGHKKRYLSEIRKILKAEARPEKSLDKKIIIKEIFGVDIELCPICKKGKMQTIIELKRGQKYYKLE